MSVEKKCLRCGSKNLEPGSIQSNRRVGFRPRKSKFLKNKSADIGVKANICIDCGHMELVGDTKKTKLLVKGPHARQTYSAGVS